MQNIKRSIETTGQKLTTGDHAEEGDRRAQGATEDIGFPVVATPGNNTCDTRDFRLRHELPAAERGQIARRGTDTADYKCNGTYAKCGYGKVRTCMVVYTLLRRTYRSTRGAKREGVSTQ